VGYKVSASPYTEDLEANTNRFRCLVLAADSNNLRGNTFREAEGLTPVIFILRLSGLMVNNICPQGMAPQLQ